LTFVNAAFDAGVAAGTPTYRAVWMRFDNATGETTPIAETQGTTPAIDAPGNPPTAPGSFIEVDLSIDMIDHPAWRRPIRTWFRRDGEGWTLVGLERLPRS
jgi:hypothetical protein